MNNLHNNKNIKGALLLKYFDTYCEEVTNGIIFRQSKTVEDAKHLKNRVQDCIKELAEETVESIAFDANGVFINIEATLYESETLYLLDFKYSDESTDTILDSKLTLYDKNSLEPFKLDNSIVEFKPI